MYEEQIEPIKSKLAQIQREGWQKYSNNFEVADYKFVMNAPIAESELLAFEETYQIRLPEDYREFLLNVGNGGAGPYHGLLLLEKWFDYENPTGDTLKAIIEEFDFDPVAHLAGEFLIEPDPMKNYGASYIGELDYSDKTKHGTIALCDQGCLFYSLLVVRGHYKGRVCHACYSGGEDYYYMPDENFLAWYERWLDETLSGKRIGWFGGYGWQGED